MKGECSRAALTYARSVARRKIPACSFVRQACQRFLDDLKRKDLFYDEEEVESCHSFISELPQVTGEWRGQPLVLAPYQCFIVANLVGLKWSAKHEFADQVGRRKYREAYIEVPRKNGKALAIDTPILTPNGWTTMGELQAGDFVFGADGMPTRIRVAHPIERDEPCYRLDFDGGESIVANAAHEWVTTVREKRPGSGRRGKDAIYADRPKTGCRTTQDIAETVRRRDGSVNHSIRMAPALAGASDVPIAPYTLGAWLGDGHTADGRITNAVADGAIIDAVEREWSGRVVRHRYASRPTIQLAAIHGLKTALRSAGLLGNKHVPDCYFTASAPVRWALLQGIMDTDGNITEGRGSTATRVEVTSTLKSLAHDYATLAYTLGFKATVRHRLAKVDGKAFDVWVASWNSDGDTRIFRLARKRDSITARRGTERIHNRYIRACKPVASVPVRCITVEAEDGMFLAGRTLVPTHNSTFLAALCLYFLRFDGEPGAEVYCSASNEEQAHKVFGPARQMLKDDDELRQFMDVEYLKTSIYNDAENLTFKPRIGDPPDGDSPSFVCIDEYHEHPHARALKTFQTGMGSRRQPLLVIITTAGTNIGGPCHQKRDEVIDVLRGTFTDIRAEKTFGVIYTVDQEGDENYWKTREALEVANPGIGWSTTLSYLLGEQAQAIRSRPAQSEFKTKHLNIWVGQNDPWIDINHWHANVWDDMVRADFIADELPCIVALDLSAKNDFCALTIIFYEDIGADEAEFWEIHEREQKFPLPPADALPEPPDDDAEPPTHKRVYWAFPYFWLPRATFDNEPRYAAWEDHIRLFEGQEIDVLRIADWLNRLIDGGMRVVELVVDPWRSIGVEQSIADRLVWTEIVRHQQTDAAYSAPMYEMQAAVDAGRFRHPGNPVLDWMVGNMPYKRALGTNYVKPERNKDDSKKIDGAVCCVMGAGRAMVQEADRPLDIPTVAM